MVGWDPSEKGRNLSPMECSVAGAFSGIITRATTQPLDVIKIRFQLQVDPIRRVEGGKYKNVAQAFKSIWFEEGMKALWKGHIPAQGLSVAYGMVQFGTFDIFTRMAWQFAPDDIKHVQSWRTFFHLGSGAAAGCLATTVSLPFDVLRTRMAAQGEPKMYKNLLDATLLMYKNEGLLAFYKGFIPSIVAIAPYTGISESLICGTASGAIAKGLVFPLDVLKKRLMIIGFESARHEFGTVHRYSGLTNCLISIVKHEGIRGLFKGGVPGLLKAGAASGIGFFSYEQCCAIIKWHNLDILKSNG